MSVRRAASAGDKVTVLLRTSLQDNRLSFRARGVLASVLSRPQDWQTSASGLARQSPTEGRDAMKTALIELETCGYLRRRKWQDPTTGHWVWHWDISDDPDSIRADEPQENPQVTDIPAGQTSDGSPVDGSPDLGSPDLGPPDLGQDVAITGGRSSGGRSSGGRRNPPRAPDGVLIGADGSVLDAELPIAAPSDIERLVQTYAAAYLRSGGTCTVQTRSVVARSCKRLLSVDGIPLDVLEAAVETAGARRSKDIDSRIEPARALTTAATTAGVSSIVPNVSPDDPVWYRAECRAIEEHAAAGTLDIERYMIGNSTLTQPPRGQ